MFKRKFYLIAAILITSVVMSACGVLGGNQPPATQDVKAIGQTAVAQYQATQQAMAPAATQPGSQPMAENTPTAQPETESCLAALPKSVNRPYEWLNNLDVGDFKLTSLLYTRNGSGDSLVALIDPVFNFDVEAPNMTGVYYQTTEWSWQSLTCAAHELAEQNEVTNLIYIGLGDAPEGFTKVYKVAGFTTSIWIYTEAPVETPGTRWETYTAAKSDKSHTYGEQDAYQYGQFWNGENSKTVYHWITEPGWLITTPNFQGTYWAVFDWSDVFDSVMARFMQMTGEVEQRDGHPTVVKVFCGDDEAPSGYSAPAQPSDWTCERMP